MEISELKTKSLEELRTMGEELGIPSSKHRKKEYLMVNIASRTVQEDNADGAGKGNVNRDKAPEVPPPLPE